MKLQAARQPRRPTVPSSTPSWARAGSRAARHRTGSGCWSGREDSWQGLVPLGGLLLTAGADVQRDRVEVSVWAWGREKECWLVEHRVPRGDPGRPEVWKAAQPRLVAESWPSEAGPELRLKGLAIDSGYATQEVYAWVRTQSASLVFAVKGVERGAALVGPAHGRGRHPRRQAAAARGQGAGGGHRHGQARAVQQPAQGQARTQRALPRLRAPAQGGCRVRACSSVPSSWSRCATGGAMPGGSGGSSGSGTRRWTATSTPGLPLPWSGSTG